MNIPRGIQNNNPGNIKKGLTKWEGMKDPGFDPHFVEFSSPLFGLRALMKVLLTYHRKYGLDTISSVLNRWAPPSENPTDYYITHVAHQLNASRFDQISLENSEVLMGFAKAICVFENGWPSKTYPKHWYADSLYREAADLALGKTKPTETKQKVYFLHKQPV